MNVIFCLLTLLNLLLSAVGGTHCSFGGIKQFVCEDSVYHVALEMIYAGNDRIRITHKREIGKNYINVAQAK